MKKTVGENLKMFRIKKGFSMAEAGKLIGVSAPAILKFESNKIIASLDRLETFSKIYDCTLDDLLNVDSNISIKFSNVYFKEKTSDIKKELVKNYIEDKIENYFNLLKLSNITYQNKFGVHLINSINEAESLATKLRIFFQIPIDEPISNLVYLLENHDMMIMTVPKKIGGASFLGFYETILNVPVIFVPEADNGYEQRYLIAKYLGNLLIMSDKNKDELSNAFALSLLIPEKALFNSFEEKRVKIEFREIEIFSDIFKVSYKNIIKRLLETRIITPSNAKYTNIYINKNNIKENAYTEEPYNYDKLYSKLVAKGLIKNQLS